MSERPRIVVSLMDEAQEYQRYQADEARSAAALLGFDLEVVFAENVAILQIHELFEFIQAPPERRPQAIVVQTVSGEGLRRVAEAAVRAGIGWVVINRAVQYIDRLREINPRVPLGVIGPNQLEVGRIQGRQIRALLPPADGLVLLVQGPSDTSAAQLRLEGALQELGGVEVKVIEGQWTEQSGEQVVERWIRMKRGDPRHPAVVACQNDHMAVGARRAVRRHLTATRIPVLGVDGLPEGGQRLVRTGQLAATVVVPPSTAPALQWTAQALKNGAPLLTEVILTPTSYPDMATLRTTAAGQASAVV